MEFFKSVDEIDTAILSTRIAELKAFLEKPKLELRNVYNIRLTRLNEGFRGRSEALTTQGGAFLERRLKSLQLEYLQEVEKLISEFKEKLPKE
jgi:hypothetical protein